MAQVVSTPHVQTYCSVVIVELEAGNLREECGIDRDGHAGLCVPFDPN